MDQKESEMQALKQQVAELIKVVKAQNVPNDKKNGRSSQERTESVEGPRGSSQGLLVLDHRQMLWSFQKKSETHLMLQVLWPCG